MIKHLRVTGCVVVSFQCPSRSSTLHHFDLVCAVVLDIRSGVPDYGTVFELWSDNGHVDLAKVVELTLTESGICFCSSFVNMFVPLKIF